MHCHAALPPPRGNSINAMRSAQMACIMAGRDWNHGSSEGIHMRTMNKDSQTVPSEHNLDDVDDNMERIDPVQLRRSRRFEIPSLKNHLEAVHAFRPRHIQMMALGIVIAHFGIDFQVPLSLRLSISNREKCFIIVGLSQCCWPSY
jgi:hypothetical protein